MLPLRLLVLDLVGSAFFTLGLIKLLLDVDTLPAWLRFDHYHWALLALGVTLWLPALIFIALRIREGFERAGRNG